MTENSVFTTRSSIHLNDGHKNNLDLCYYFPIHSVAFSTVELREFNNIVIKMGNGLTRLVQLCLCGVEWATFQIVDILLLMVVMLVFSWFAKRGIRH
jgi:hypothetical protein